MQNEVLEIFEVEALEKRYEMGWIKSAEINGKVTSDGKMEAGFKLGIK
ncbi:hypothetical protein [Maribacter sp. MJ134]|nr:hypothetical protein [Maribacter sp. MJ134]